MASTDFKDYYQVLGVERSSSADAVKKKFRKLALKYHPDRNPGDQAAEAKFKEISEAYEVLSDPDKRKKYDQFGQYWQQANPGPGGNSGASGFGFNTEGDGAGFDFSQYGNFEEFISELLGGNRGRSRSYRSGAGSGGFGGFGEANTSGDQTAKLALTFGEAFRGVEKRLRVGQENIDVRIPAGAKSGTKLRVKGKGSMDPFSRQRGDLYLLIDVQPHNFFKFEGDNLTGDLPITPDEAALGAAVSVPTPDGAVTMKIPAGIRSGQSLRLRGKGWPKPRGQRSDLFVKVEIVVPKQISDEERKLYEQLRSLRSSDPRSHLNFSGL